MGRYASAERRTKETDIRIEIDLDGDSTEKSIRVSDFSII